MRRGAKGNRVLMIVENNPVPRDLRVWQEATALNDAGYQVTVISPRPASTRTFSEVIDGIRVLRHPRVLEAARSWQYVVEYCNAIFWELALSFWVALSVGIDIVHIANPPDVAFVLAPLMRLMRVKVIFDQHDLSPEIFEAKFEQRGMFWRLLHAMERLSFRASDIVITPNESMKELAIGRGGCKPDDVFVVRNGPNLDRFAAVSNADAAGPGDRLTVSYVGIIGEQEGLESYLRVIDVLVNERERVDTDFVIVGDGSGLPPLRRAAEKMGLSSFIEFTGFLTGDELIKTMSRADVCVVPEPVTPLTEHSTLIKTMEYMAMGKPVVQYDMVEARFTSGDTSLYARPNDESDFADNVARLLDDPQTRLEMGADAKRRVHEQLAWQHQIPSLLIAYRALESDGETP